MISRPKQKYIKVFPGLFEGEKYGYFVVTTVNVRDKDKIYLKEPQLCSELLSKITGPYRFERLQRLINLDIPVLVRSLKTSNVRLG